MEMFLNLCPTKISHEVIFDRKTSQLKLKKIIFIFLQSFKSYKGYLKRKFSTLDDMFSYEFLKKNVPWRLICSHIYTFQVNVSLSKKFLVNTYLKKTFRSSKNYIFKHSKAEIFRRNLSMRNNCS